jgi:holo-[acyl-carrier protein] synthase
MIRLHQGIDVVSTARLEAVCRRHQAFLSEVFTKGEREYCLAQADPYVHLAGRFAAKEAALKALGLGLARAALGCIEVTRVASGQPGLAFSGWVAAQSRRRRIRQSTLSISHSAGVAMASVILLAGASGGD